MRSTSSGVVATRSLPHVSNGMPCSVQNALVAAAPSRHSRAFRLPGA